MEEYYTQLTQLRADLSELIDLISEELYRRSEIEQHALIPNLDDALSGLDAALLIYPRGR